MTREELAKTTPGPGGMRDVRLQCEEDMLGKPLAECEPKEVGRFGEDLAAFYLEQCGYTILERNWRCKFGEADIIVSDGDTIVLVEVKTRTTREEAGELAPEVAVNYRKRAKYEKIALKYLSGQVRCDAVRFDVIAVKLLGNRDSILRHLVGAYEWDD